MSLKLLQANSGPIEINFDSDPLLKTLTVVVVRAWEVINAPSSESLIKDINQLIQMRKTAVYPPEDLKNRVRDVFRNNFFKPTGRSKPASEYLAQAAQEDNFPFINNLVDVNNLLSLECAYPISMLDAQVLGEKAYIRLGKTEKEFQERYIFNAAGQSIGLAGLACACREKDSVPLGNPVKDSMEGKVKVTTTQIWGFIWAPSPQTPQEIEDLGHLGQRFCHLLEKYAQAKRTTWAVVQQE